MMTETNDRRLPVGIQSFEKIRKEKYLYVDKTDLVWKILSNIIRTSDVTGGGAELFLYQPGYLTIKSYSNGVYFLGIPNHEVRQALYEMVLPALAMRNLSDIQSPQAFLRDT